MRELASTYGWQNVEDNIHMLPAVDQLTPSEWISMLTVDERAVTASKFTRFTEATKLVDSIDPKAELDSKSVAAIAEYVEARTDLENFEHVVVGHVHAILSSSFPHPYPYNPGTASDCLHTRLFCHAYRSDIPHLSKRRKKSRKVIDICKFCRHIQNRLWRRLLAFDRFVLPRS